MANPMEQFKVETIKPFEVARPGRFVHQQLAVDGDRA